MSPEVLQHGGVVAPGREPVSGVPIPPAATHEDDTAIAMLPPTAVMPLAVIVAEYRIILSPETIATPVIGYDRSSLSIDREIGADINPSITCETPFAVQRHVIANSRIRGVPANYCVCAPTDSGVHITVNPCIRGVAAHTRH